MILSLEYFLWLWCEVQSLAEVKIDFFFLVYQKIKKKMLLGEEWLFRYKCCYTPAPPEGGYTVLPLSFVHPKIFFVAFFSATIDGRNLIFGHKLHIGTPYRGKRFWTHQIPTSCLPTWLVFIHIEHICGGIISEH